MNSLVNTKQLRKSHWMTSQTDNPKAEMISPETLKKKNQSPYTRRIHALNLTAINNNVAALSDKTFKTTTQSIGLIGREIIGDFNTNSLR